MSEGGPGPEGKHQQLSLPFPNEDSKAEQRNPLPPDESNDIPGIREQALAAQWKNLDYGPYCAPHATLTHPDD